MTSLLRGAAVEGCGTMISGGRGDAAWREGAEGEKCSGLGGGC